ncbi:hypothetical protein SAMN04488564_103466 [Lentzea waywayandensis]|uniref:Glutathione synthase/RimK-type ligase, ATP-grasp superfamily n=1 Tax=Lentzea waywayandensis TaxID=84724 RepID=A0A1I6DZ11_9PSEU|nr:hypothetical protein [Lentzea waywayandensis]SFR10764.1 hypothetical protein SAMN04488564_103466 [Lentzea waywayandensis]
MPTRPSVLYVSNLAYPARGRRYCDEDIYLTSHLRQHFDLAVCHPEDAAALMANFDTVVVRNSGPVIDYLPAYDHFRAQAKATGQRVYNPLTGKADMAGKQYLVDLTERGYPVIPTIDRPDALDRLPQADIYVVKPKTGADSHGLEFVGREEVLGKTGDLLIQPKIDFRYEVSFYFVDHDFQYALHAPDPARRWELTGYAPTPEDLEFAQKFIDWNGLGHGVQRVDACRTKNGDLLLVELEDLNPYLSLNRTTDETRAGFTSAFTASIRRSLI